MTNNEQILDMISKRLDIGAKSMENKFLLMEVETIWKKV